MEGQRKRFDLEPPAAVSLAMERRKLELGDLCAGTAVMALATGTNTSFLDRLYKKQVTVEPTCRGLHIAKQLDSREDIVVVIVIQVVDFALCVLASHIPLES